MDRQIVLQVYIAIMRYAVPAASTLLLLRCGLSLLAGRQKQHTWGYLVQQDGQRLPILHWETLIGRASGCDIVLEMATASRHHALLKRYDDGSWTLSDTDSKSGIQVNGQRAQIWALTEGDRLQIGGVMLQFFPVGAQENRSSRENGWKSATDLLLLTAIECSICVGAVLNGMDGSAAMVWPGLMALQWSLYLLYRMIGRAAFEVETLAFFLCALGLGIIGTVHPGSLYKQLFATGLGIMLYLMIGWSLRDLERATRLRYFAAVTGICLLLVTLLFGQVYYGAKNWITVAGFSLQPSELVKICFVYTGAATLDRLLRKRNIFLFILYTVAMCGLLACMNDFGTAMIFFITFLLIAFLRSGSLGVVGLACAALLFAGAIGLQIAPHALQRLQTWRNIWRDPWGTGYQQTQALMCMASGGLFGIGQGQGKLRYIFAADSDLAFASLAEEWGLVMGVYSVLCIGLLALFSLRMVKNSRSSFYVIGSCAAAGILLTQTAFHVLGTVDLLPLTGVTFPFLSNGGSSMLSVWGLLAFIKAADTRYGGSLAVKREKRKCA